MISMSSFHAMLIPILTGMILLAVGFNFRDKNARRVRHVDRHAD